MKEIRELNGNWILREENGDTYAIPHMPMQVHEILYANGKIGNGYQWGKTDDCKWVNEKTWIYETEFDCEGEALLLFEGLDTLCRIYLNGTEIGESRDCYLPLRIPVTSYLRDKTNKLELVFAPVSEELKRIEEEQEELLKKTSVLPRMFIRKTLHDFTDYLGNDTDFYKVGVFRPVLLITLPEKIMLDELHTSYRLNEKLNNAQLEITPVLYQADGISEDILRRVEIRVCVSIDGTEIWSDVQREGTVFHASLENIRLWWPRGYGDQPLYKISAELRCVERDSDIVERNVIVDTCCVQTGFRKVQMQGMLDFLINGKRVKLWGANLTPDEGSTLCEDRDRMHRLLKLAVEANINTLRIWGEGTPLTDYLYDYADRHGILLWQEFFCGHAQYPMCGGVTELILQEAEYMIKSRRHHPSILLWCGGNECYLSRDFAAPDEEYLAASFFEYELRKLCKKLDPDRYYHVSSPFFGTYTNEPSLGDTHSYTNSWYVPGSEYPIFASENLRVCFPRESSLKRYLQVDELPAPGMQQVGNLPWPEAYERITSAESWKKIPPVEQFYDASTPAEMIYRFGMAAGHYIKDSVERYRRGKRAEESLEARRCMGHFIWKWNTTFPHIYSSMIDAYLEPKIPYYFLKRSYEPVMLSIEVSDHIDIWGINDTAQIVKGEAGISLFDMVENRFIRTESFPLYLLPGESKVLARLDHWGQMTRDKIIYGELHSEEGEILSRNHSYLDIERHICFPEPEIKISRENNALILQSNCFARCVELTGDENGEEYGWDFSDNYFDLFPGEKKRIEIMGRHKKGCIYAKGFYGSLVTEIRL